MQVNPASLFRRIKLPGYKRRAPDPISVGVMASTPIDVKRTRRYRRQQAWMDRHFWGLIHDHDWLQYDPPKANDHGYGIRPLNPAPPPYQLDPDVLCYIEDPNHGPLRERTWRCWFRCPHKDRS